MPAIAILFKSGILNEHDDFARLQMNDVIFANQYIPRITDHTAATTSKNPYFSPDHLVPNAEKLFQKLTSLKPHYNCLVESVTFKVWQIDALCRIY